MRQPTRLAILLAFAALYLIWGSTYLFIRLAIDSIPPFLMAGSRYLTAGVLMYVIARAQGAKSPTLVTWRSSLIVGGFLLLGGNGGVTVSEQYLDTGLAAVIVATVPIYIVLLSWMIGAIIGFSAYIYLLRHCDPAKVATYAYVNPIVAVILGALFAGEHLTSRTIVAAALIIGSVAIVITTQQLRPKSVPPVSAALVEAD